MEELLEKFGLSKNESKVYLVLLDLGLTTSKNIIARTSLHRQLVYDALNLLIGKGLASYIIEANRKCFRATDPKEFLEYFNKKEQELEKQKEDFRKILPQLTSIKSLNKEEQEATIYQGNKGIKVLLDDMLEQKKEIFTIGSSDINAESFKYHLKFNLPLFHRLREQKKIRYKILFSEEMKTRAKEINKLKNSQAKILPEEFTSNSSTNIYGDKVSLIMWGEEPFGILIKSKDIAEAQRKHFDMLWSIGKNP